MCRQSVEPHEFSRQDGCSTPFFSFCLPKFELSKFGIFSPQKTATSPAASSCTCIAIWRWPDFLGSPNCRPSSVLAFGRRLYHHHRCISSTSAFQALQTTTTMTTTHINGAEPKQHLAGTRHPEVRNCQTMRPCGTISSKVWLF